MNPEERARALVGVRFRPQGRTPELGLDCIGLAACVFGLTDVRRDYRLRGGDMGSLALELIAGGFVRVSEAAAGDVLVARAGPGQLHLVILTDAGFVHADAGLRRVVEVPGAVSWPVLGAWRREGPRASNNVKRNC